MIKKPVDFIEVSESEVKSLQAENVWLKGELASETAWAKQYHDEAQQAKTELEAVKKDMSALQAAAESQIRHRAAAGLLRECEALRTERDALRERLEKATWHLKDQLYRQCDCLNDCKNDCPKTRTKKFLNEAANE